MIPGKYTADNIFQKIAEDNTFYFEAFLFSTLPHIRNFCSTYITNECALREVLTDTYNTAWHYRHSFVVSGKNRNAYTGFLEILSERLQYIPRQSANILYTFHQTDIRHFEAETPLEEILKPTREDITLQNKLLNYTAGKIQELPRISYSIFIGMSEFNLKEMADTLKLSETDVLEEYIKATISIHVDVELYRSREVSKQ